MEARPLAPAHNGIAQQMVDCHHGLAPASVADNNGPSVFGKLGMQLRLPGARFIRDSYFQWRTVNASAWPGTGRSVLRKACASSGSSKPSISIVSPVPRGGASNAHAAYRRCVSGSGSILCLCIRYYEWRYVFGGYGGVAPGKQYNFL